MASTRDAGHSFADEYKNPDLIGTERGKHERAKREKGPNVRHFATLVAIVIVVSVVSHTLIRLFG